MIRRTFGRRAADDAGGAPPCTPPRRKRATGTSAGARPSSETSTAMRTVSRRSRSRVLMSESVYSTHLRLAGLRGVCAAQADFLSGCAGCGGRGMLQDPATTVKDAAFSQARNGYSVRTDRWRYVEL